MRDVSYSPACHTIAREQHFELTSFEIALRGLHRMILWQKF
jgi:hypothetical protein